MMLIISLQENLFHFMNEGLTAAWEALVWTGQIPVSELYVGLDCEQPEAYGTATNNCTKFLTQPVFRPHQIRNETQFLWR
jgi:hypothetical protein